MIDSEALSSYILGKVLEIGVSENMVVPRVFVSSTCFDLRDIRDVLSNFIKSYGFEPVLSDKGDVYFDYSMHTHDSCLKEIQKCNLFTLIIGGRFGGKYIGNPDKSIVNAEYDVAKELNLPIFTFIKGDVWHEHLIYEKNKSTKYIIRKIKYPSIEKQETAIKIFEFINHVRLPDDKTNNAIYTFESFEQILDILRKQWAAMFANLLHKSSGVNLLNTSNHMLYLDLKSASTGIDRTEAFQKIRSRAKQRISIVGIGMTNLSRYAINSLMEQAAHCNIEFVMLDPAYLKQNKPFSKQLEKFLRIPHFVRSVEQSFEIIKEFCESWNSNSSNTTRMKLIVYDTLPTMSMVMIDPELESGEIVIEFFVHNAGEKRPMFHILKSELQDSFFGMFYSVYTNLVRDSRMIVE